METVINLKGRSLLTLLDYTPQEIRCLLDLAARFKGMKKTGVLHRYLEGKNIVLIFDKTSTRTRCAFEVAAMDLGMGVTFLGSRDSQMNRKESVADTARVLGRMYDGIEYRGFEQKTVEALAEYSGVPVWNGLTDSFHPTQMLADLLTVEEHKGRLKGVNLTYFGDGRNNTCNSLMVACAKMGLNLTVCAPKELYPESSLTERCRAVAASEGGSIRFTESVEEGARNADVIYTDIWVSMGEPDSIWRERISLLTPYRVDSRVMSLARSDAIFMHCLPSFHDTKTEIGREISEKYGISEMEVSDAVFEGPQSAVFDEAENRLHTIKAVLYASLKEE